MNQGSDSPITFRLCDGVSTILPSQWSALAGTTRGLPDYNPFVSHAFLSALEKSGSVGERTGWAPKIAVLEDGQGAILAAAPS